MVVASGKDEGVELDFYLKEVLESPTEYTLVVWEKRRSELIIKTILLPHSNFSIQLEKALGQLLGERINYVVSSFQNFKDSDNPELDILISQRTSRIDSLYLKGLYLQFKGEYDSAITIFKSIVTLNPNFYKATYSLAISHKRKHDFENYKTYLFEANTLTNNNKDVVLLEIGNYYAHNKNYSKAIGYYNIVRNSPLYYDIANWNLFIAYKRLNNTHEAKKILSSIPRESSFYLDAINQLYLMEETEKETEKSQKFWTTLFKNSLSFILVIIFCLFLFKVYRKVSVGTQIQDQKFELLMASTSAVLALLLNLAGKFLGL